LTRPRPGAILRSMDELREKISNSFARWENGFPVGPETQLTLLHGDASARRYVRVRGREPEHRAVAMVLAPETARFSEEAMKGPAPEELPFVNMQRFLRRLGVRVPEIYWVDESLGVLLLEDLGDETLERSLSGADRTRVEELYREAVDLLVDFQARVFRNPDPACVAFSRSFETDLLRWELEHFIEYLVEVDRGATITGTDREVVDKAFDELADAIAAWPRILVHRDFQSRNLMRRNGETVILDFQDALMGPVMYDLVALLRDSYFELDPAQLDSLIGHYLNACRSAGLDRPEPEVFREQFDRLTLQRKLKDAGRFVFIDRKKGNPNFLPFIPASLRYAAEAFSRLGSLASCREVLAGVVPELAR
jgi:N-acetylmuramate 1-kinase